MLNWQDCIILIKSFFVVLLKIKSVMLSLYSKNDRYIFVMKIRNKISCNRNVKIAIKIL